MTRTRHVIGAGVSGLTAAMLSSRQGWRTVVHEASPHAGGRCRTVVRDGIIHDNGTHVLLSANRQTLDLLRTIGASGSWIEPEPHGLPVVDLASSSIARVGLSPWSWAFSARRPPGIGPATLMRLLPILKAPHGRSVASYAAGSPGMAQLLELMCVAVLNTPPVQASAHLLGQVLRRLLVPGAARLLVARSGLGADLIQPLLDAVQARGGSIRFGRRLLQLRRHGDRAITLLFNDHAVELGQEDEVVLAVPPQALQDLLPELPRPDAFEPIVNLHWPHSASGPIRFVGMTGSLAQWLLVRPGTVSVTISAAAAVVGQPAAWLADRVWPEVEQACRLLRIDLGTVRHDAVSVVKERMATPCQDCAYALNAPPLRRPLANVALAGDWTGSLPATIEGAVQAGRDAIAALGGFGPRLDRDRDLREAVA